MIKNNYKSKGFTLVELLVYVSTSGIVILIIISVLFMLMQSKSKSNAISEVEQQGNFAMDTILQSVRNAETINSPVQGASSAVFELDVVDSLADPTTYDLNSGKIRITEGVTTPVDLTSAELTITNLNFQNLSRNNTPGNVRISFTITKEANGRGSYFYEKTFYSSASLRY